MGTASSATSSQMPHTTMSGSVVASTTPAAFTSDTTTRTVAATPSGTTAKVCMSDTLVLPISVDGTDCPSILQDGQQCAVICPPQHQSVGFFTCSQEVLVGESVCLMLPQDAA